ncbi:MAG TPA: hypothetical protein VJ577_12415, partial [Burkholderiaceae bacterium]|nr:hypothetical protein [Burkholderiaceae bacterium]
IVIVITGIIAGTVAVFLRLPVQGYVDTAARAELTDIADTALRRMTRDLRLALPNSIRLTTDGSGNKYLELLLTKTGGRYLAEEDAAGTNFLNFSDPADLTFDVVGAMPAGEQAIVPNDFIVVYNLGPGQSPADAYADCGVIPGCNRARVASAPAGNTVTLVSNPFAAQKSPTPPNDPLPMPSPRWRFQVVTTPVTYVCNPTAHTLTRYWDYAIQPTQPASLASLASAPAWATPKNALLASSVNGCEFSLNNLVSVRTALIGLQLTLQNQANGGSVVLFHQVHVDNTP